MTSPLPPSLPALDAGELLKVHVDRSWMTGSSVGSTRKRATCNRCRHRWTIETDKIQQTLPRPAFTA
ncbi:hypothetical protein C4D60_Mb09t04500 [Musa balbisiana]|uniref:Uncharacterized protein n=1 Tax=Musa balbisiana TaxID=52838 RepID=A0A4S8IE06_MUSBA|nr:hypothetical protein C4D60_Mb09t04500 [Musa balbisiana]